eukprot:CAMPEP_0198209092 /NCGR_PEP_ID=MMETSP1445-20131203/12405_1 /TAXON_ID=36898 /ORGANISM="Pyramimonas sp., Strain CCMP2087" /LENGTH=334 /DNA_ID=CAMNT_0043882727 /DNA_START=111 /DNA_END=1112 /DNA_ORIENTATION=-
MSLIFDVENFPAPLAEHLLLALLIVVVTIFLLRRRQLVSSCPTVSELNIYPIKSCANIRVKEAIATELGFENDRIAQVSDQNGKYCTPREKKYAKLFHVKPTLKQNKLVLSAAEADSSFELDLVDGKTKSTSAEPMIGPRVILQDHGDDFSSWLETATGIQGCRLTAIGDGYNREVEVNPDQNDPLPFAAPPVSLADEAPYLLTSDSSLADLNKRLTARGQTRVDMRRFRPNIVVSGLKPWQEDTLSKIRIGRVEFHVWQRCGRCVMTTIDRDSLARGPEPLATLDTFRDRDGQRNFGMHMVPVAPVPVAGDNVIRLGDKLEILEYDETRKAEW